MFVQHVERNSFGEEPFLSCVRDLSHLSSRTVCTSLFSFVHVASHPLVAVSVRVVSKFFDCLSFLLPPGNPQITVGNDEFR
jgi:hypothetical protein